MRIFTSAGDVERAGCPAIRRLWRRAHLSLCRSAADPTAARHAFGRSWRRDLGDMRFRQLEFCSWGRYICALRVRACGVCVDFIECIVASSISSRGQSALWREREPDRPFGTANRDLRLVILVCPTLRSACLACWTAARRSPRG